MRTALIIIGVVLLLTGLSWGKRVAYCGSVICAGKFTEPTAYGILIYDYSTYPHYPQGRLWFSTSWTETEGFRLYWRRYGQIVPAKHG